MYTFRYHNLLIGLNKHTIKLTLVYRCRHCTTKLYHNGRSRYFQRNWNLLLYLVLW